MNAPDAIERQQQLLTHAPIPTLWLYGKTGSGKTSIIRYLTGATDAEIGSGFRPQTVHWRRYDFPDSETPLARFLDTRGIGEANYDPAAEVAEFDSETHLMIVTVRIMDQAVEEILLRLKQLKKTNSQRPVLLVLTCLHDVYPGQQHPTPTPTPTPTQTPTQTDPASQLSRARSAQIARFSGLFDAVVEVDLTLPNEGFEQPDYGGQALKAAILELLPAAYRQTLLQLDELNQSLTAEHNRRVAPVILAHSALAATAAAVPLPWADIPLVLGIQTRLAYKIAKLNHQTIDAKKIGHVTTAMGGRIALQMGIRESLKFIPWVGIAANVAATFAFTYAAGWAWNWYFVRVAAGHAPTDAELRNVYQDQLTRGANLWKTSTEKNST